MKEVNEVVIEKATIVENKGCASCAIGALCFSDGPIPDFEIAGLLSLYGITG